jgi:hypothetical protein
MRFGIGIGLLLVVIWAVAFVVMKITSFAIHSLLLAALVFAALQLMGRFNRGP